MLAIRRGLNVKTAALLMGIPSLHMAYAQEGTPAPAEDPWLASGCSMAKGTALMTCLGDYASVPPAAPSGISEQDQAIYFCDIYQQLADCWAAGLYCKEWYPMQLAADKFCALANTTTSSSASLLDRPTQTTTLAPHVEVPGIIAAVAGLAELSPTSAPSPARGVDSNTLNTLSSIVEEASNVITSIWNNDSGTDIPVITNDIATISRATWTHMTESTPLPATDPLASATYKESIVPTAAPAKARRKIALRRA